MRRSNRDRYLPPFDTITIYFCKALVTGTAKKFVSCDRVRYLNVPQYEELSLAKIYDFLSDYPDFNRYMPETEQEVKKLPRGFIINVGATIVGETWSSTSKSSKDSRLRTLNDKHWIYIYIHTFISIIIGIINIHYYHLHMGVEAT